MRLFVLGEVRLADERGTRVQLPPQQTTILGVLAGRLGEVVGRDELIDDLWGVRDPALRARLAKQITPLRHRLGSALTIESDRAVGYRLQVAPGVDEHAVVDARAFVTLVEEANALLRDRVGDSSEPAWGPVADTLGRALALWRGPFSFADVDSLLVDGARLGLDQLRTICIMNLARCEIALAQPDRSVSYLRALFESDPDDGQVAETLATLLAVDGNDRDALDVIARYQAEERRHGWARRSSVYALEGRILRHEMARRTRPRAAPLAERHRWIGPIVHRAVLEHDVLAGLTCGPVLLVGEAGSGKSVLTGTVAAQLENAGRPVVRVAVREDPDRPLEPVAALVDLLERRFPSAFAALVADPLVDAAVCRLRGSVGRAAVPIARGGMIAELARLIAAVASTESAVLVLEDVHWLDPTSLEVLEGVIVAGGSVLLTSRRALLDAPIERLAGVEAIGVPPFQAHEVAEMLERSGVASDERRAAALAAATGGNGLFLRLVIDGLLDVDGGSEDGLPASVQHAVHERTRGLSVATRRVLETAALLGPAFALAPLRAVHPRADAALAEAAREGLVLVESDGATGSFVHGLVCDAVVAAMPEGHRVEWHDALYEALVLHGAPPDALAKHAVGAAGVDPLRAVRACRDAATAHAAVYEWATAVHWARLGLDALADLRRSDPTREAELRAIIGTGLRRSNLAGSDAELGAAADIAIEVGDDGLLLRCVTELCLHGPTTQAGGVDEAARARLDRALVTPAPAGAQARLLSAAATLLAVSPDAARGRSLYRRALVLAETSGDAAARQEVWMNAHLGLSGPSDTAERRRVAAALLASRDREAVWEAHFLGIGLSLIDADRDAFERSYESLRRLTAEVKHRDQAPAMRQVESVAAFVRGDLAAAERHADEMLVASGRSYPSSFTAGIYAALIVPIREVQGRLAELAPHVDVMVASAPDFITWRAVAGAVAWAQGDTHAMASQLAFMEERSFEFVEDLTWTAVAALACRPVHALRATDAAAELQRQLAPFSGQMTWNGLSTHGAVDIGLALLAEVLGDRPGACHHREIAHQLARRLGAEHLSGLPEHRHLQRVPTLDEHALR